MINATVHDIARIIERIAPVALAESWDNVGLQIGAGDWPVKKIWVALDVSPRLVENAAKNRIDLLITHHPLFFSPLRKVDTSTPSGEIVATAIRHGLAIFSAHTNLDRAVGGINDLLAEKLGLKDPVDMEMNPDIEDCTLRLLIPKDRLENAINKLFDWGVKTLRLSPGAHCQIGQAGTDTEEIVIEADILRERLDVVICHLKKNSIGKIMLRVAETTGGSAKTGGLSRIGVLDPPQRLQSYAEEIKNTLRIPAARLVGNPRMTIGTVALCAGSGSSLVNAFLASRADIFVSGDLRYHDARKIEDHGRGAIDIGHFYSERFYLDEFISRLKKALRYERLTVDVSRCARERDPFTFF